MTLAAGLLATDPPPAHSLLGEAVAVLLVLTALGSVGLALHGALRRKFGSTLVVLLAVAVGGVLASQATGRALAAGLSPNPQVQRHAITASHLLPCALGFGVAVIVLLVAGRLADRERAASGDPAGRPDTAQDRTGPPLIVSTAWRRIAMLASVLVIGMAVITTWQVVGTGISGISATWQRPR